jgi:hypothetical protein
VVEFELGEAKNMDPTVTQVAICEPPENLSPAELSSLVDLVQAQIEYHQEEIARLRPILHRLQAQIPNNPIRDFINSLD